MAYTGNVGEIPMLGGLHGAQNVSQVKAGFLLEADNVTFENNTVQKEGGASKYNAVALSGNVISGFDWWPDTVTQRMVVFTSDGKFMKDDGSGAFATTLASGLTASDVCNFVAGGKEVAANNRKLFCFTGKNQVKVLSGDGATVADIGVNKPADWTSSYPYYGAIHEFRLWGGGNNNDPHRLYYSTTTDHEDFVGAGSGSISVYPGEGIKTIGAVSTAGVLVVFKYPVGIYVIDTRDPAVANWGVYRVSDQVGACNQNAISMQGSDVIFLDQIGQVQLLSTSDVQGGFALRALTDIAQMNIYMANNTDAALYPDKTRVVHYQKKKETHFFVPGDGSTVPNRRVVFDMNGEIPRWRSSSRDTGYSIWIRLNSNQQQMALGDNAGFVWLMDTTDRSKGGAAYRGQFQTAHVDFSHLDPSLAAKRKNGNFLELIMDQQGNWNLIAEIFWDGVLRQTISFNMGTTGAALGTFVLDTDQLGSQAIAHMRRRLVGGGKRISIRFRNEDASADFSISNVLVHFTVGDERDAA